MDIKKLGLAAAAVAVAGIMAAGVALAQEAPEGRRAREERPGIMRGFTMPPDFLQTLSEEQRNGIAEIRRRQNDRIQAIREAGRQEVNALLTREQRQQWEQLLNEKREQALQRRAPEKREGRRGGQ